MLSAKLQAMTGKLLGEQEITALGTGTDSLRKLAEHPSYNYLQTEPASRVSLQNQLYVSYIRDVNKIAKAQPHVAGLERYTLVAQTQAIAMCYLGLGELELDSQVWGLLSGGVMKGFEVDKLAKATQASMFLPALGTSVYAELLQHVPWADYPQTLAFYLHSRDKRQPSKHKSVLDNYMDKKEAEIRTLIRQSERRA